MKAKLQGLEALARYEDLAVEDEAAGSQAARPSQSSGK